MTEFISYSGLLIKFIEPLLEGNEDDEEFLMKAKVGQVAWNQSISDEFKLPFAIEMKAAIKSLDSMYPEMKEIHNMLVIRKALEFPEYKQFLLTVENRHKADGTVNLYVESVPVDKLKL